MVHNIHKFIGTNSSFAMFLSKSGAYGESISYLVRAVLLSCNLPYGPMGLPDWEWKKTTLQTGLVEPNRSDL